MNYFDFDNTKEFAVCIDSDGCAMDTMEVKHRECFGPQWIKTYGLEDHFDECTHTFPPGSTWILLLV